MKSKGRQFWIGWMAVATCGLSYHCSSPPTPSAVLCMWRLTACSEQTLTPKRECSKEMGRPAH
eukprot:3628587-Karenia_brevis.AAC.1